MKQDNLMKVFERSIYSLPSKTEVTVKPIIERLSNIYENEDVPAKIGFTVEAENGGKYTILCSMLDQYGNTCFLCEKSIPAGEKVYVDIPDLTDKYGIFTLCVTVRNGDETVYEQRIPFSHLRTASTHFKKSGTCVHLFFHDIPDTYDCIKLLKKCGLYKIRDDLNWHRWETEKSVVKTPEYYHNTVNAFVDAGFEINAILDYGNPFYEENKPPITPDGIAAYSNFCAKAAMHYKGKVFRYEIWNEYNLGAVRKASDYAQMLKAAYTAIKAVDPDIIVTAGVTSGTHTEWVRNVLEAGAYNYFDEFSIHPYCGMPDSTYADENQGQTEANVQSYIDIISEYGAPKPVWISEMGWTTAIAPGVCDREEQAAALARLITVTESSNTISGLTFYDFRDDGSDYFDKEHHLGTVEAQYSIVPNSAKESYAAISCLNWMIGDTNFAEKKVTECIKQTIFKNEEKLVNVFWSLDGAKKVTVKLSGDAVMYDMYGNIKELKSENGIAVLELNENIIYINGASAEVINVEKPEKYVYDFPYTVSAVPELREDGWYIKAIIHNHLKPLMGKLRVEIPEIKVIGNFVPFKIGPGESFEVAVKVNNVDYKKRYRAFTDLFLSNGVREVNPELVSFLQIPKGKPEKTVITLNSKENYCNMINGETPNISADIALSYDEENLYFKAEVKDEVHLQTGTTADAWTDIWDGDCFELAIQPLYDGNASITRYSIIGLALTSNTNVALPWRWFTVSNRSSGLFRSCNFKAERKDGKTYYDATFKWKDLLPPNISLKDCDCFGFALRLNNADTNPRSLDGTIELYGGMGSWRAQYSYLPCEFGKFVLEK